MQSLSATNWCDITVNSAGTSAVIAFVTTGGLVTVARSPSRHAWGDIHWALETVDATSSTFSHPQVAYRATGKFFVCYQGSDFVKIAREQ